MLLNNSIISNLVPQKAGTPKSSAAKYSNNKSSTSII